jgi:beta-glucosidase
MTLTETPLRCADELLGRMTLEEKAMQLTSVVPLALIGREGPLRDQLEHRLAHGIGHVAETRLGIPAIFHDEALNGVVAAGFTAFPTPVALAATWDPVAVEEMADLMRRQMRAVGLLHALAPVMDVARDARWGRVTETYGEDPHLVGALSVAFTRGMQGADLREGVIACAKHFIGYAQTEGGQNMAAIAVGPASSAMCTAAPSRRPSGSRGWPA